MPGDSERIRTQRLEPEQIFQSPQRGKRISAIVCCRLKSRLDTFTRSLSPPTFEPIPSRRNSDRSNNHTLCELPIAIASSLSWRQRSPIATGPIWLATSVRFQSNKMLHCDMISSGEFVFNEKLSNGAGNQSGKRLRCREREDEGSAILVSQVLLQDRITLQKDYPPR